MNVLLVQSYLGKKDPLVYPLGLSYIATFLNNHKVKILDPNTLSDPWTILEKELLGFNPNVVGVSLRNIDNQLRMGTFYYYKIFREMIRFIRKHLIDVPIIVGGAGFSMFAREILERNPSIDFGIYLEGEESFPELLNNIDNPERVKGIYYRKNGSISFTGMRMLPGFEKLPPPRRDLVDVTKYTSNFEGVGIQTKRGCPLKCSYCNYPSLNGNRIRVRSPRQVVDEIENIAHLGVSHFMFADGIFNSPLDNAMDICREIIRRGLNVRWGAWLDLKYATKEFLLLAKKAGCASITFSPDAVSKKALTEMQKGITENDIKESLKILTTEENLKGLKTNYHVFINPPGETFFGFVKTLIFYFKVSFRLRRRGGVYIGWIRIEPETGVYEAALKDKVLSPDTDLLPDNEEDLHHLFYSNPHLKYLDPLVTFLLTAINIMKGIISWRKNTKAISRI